MLACLLGVRTPLMAGEPIACELSTEKLLNVGPGSCFVLARYRNRLYFRHWCVIPTPAQEGGCNLRLGLFRAAILEGDYTVPNKNLKPKVIENCDATERYANKLVGTSFDGGAIIITLGVARFTPERIDDPPRDGEDPTVTISHRIAMSPACAIEMLTAVNQLLGAVAMHNQTKVVPGQTPGPQTH